MCTAVLGAS